MAASTDFECQYGNELPQLATCEEYEAACLAAGVVALSAEELTASAYGLKHADYTRAEWMRKTREERVGFVLAAAHLRIVDAARLAKPAAPAAYRFTCRRCGEHRDTTVRGHCDDCEA